MILLHVIGLRPFFKKRSKHLESHPIPPKTNNTALLYAF